MLNKTIVVLGPTGVGKSSFIRNAVPEGISTDVQVGHHLHSETSQVQSIHLPTQNGLGINLVDTPGFDDSRQGVTDADILAMIAMFLTTQHREGTFHLSGFIYLHRISDTRVGGTSKRNIRIFQKLCGQDSLKNVVIVTTMWDKVTQEEGLRREQELMFSDNLFKPILDGGAILMRHDGTQQSAHDVIKHLFKLESTVPQIVRELVIEKRNLLDTEAGMELQKEVRDVLQRHQRDLQRLEDEIREAIQQRDKRTEIEAVLDRRKVEGDIAKLHGELRKLGNSSDAMDNRGRTTVQKRGNTQHATTGNFTGTGRDGQMPANELKELNKAKISSVPVTMGGDHLTSDYANAHTNASNYPLLPKLHPDHVNILPLEHQSSALHESARSGVRTTTHHSGNHLRTDAWVRPEAKCIYNCLELLSRVKRTQSMAIPANGGVMESIICRTTDFAIAVVCGIECARRMRSEAQSVLTSRSAHELHNFADELNQALTQAYERLSRAQQRMKDATRSTDQGVGTVQKLVGLLRTGRYSNGRAVARLPEAIIQAAETAVDSIGDLVKWWARLIEMISQLKKDAARVVALSPTFDGKVMATVEHIICDLDSHDTACRLSAYELLEMTAEFH